MAGSKIVRFEMNKTVQTVRCINQPVQKFVFRLKGPPIASHNPLGGLSVQPFELVHN